MTLEEFVDKLAEESKPPRLVKPTPSDDEANND
jgi:hypothetical protein